MKIPPYNPFNSRFIQSNQRDHSGYTQPVEAASNQTAAKTHADTDRLDHIPVQRTLCFHVDHRSGGAAGWLLHG